MQTYLCLTVVETWQLFSNHGEKGDALAKAISLEGIHESGADREAAQEQGGKPRCEHWER